MKIILSRKGFDSETGGIPSPIMPDGTMLSLPIPDEKELGVPIYAEQKSYESLNYKGICYKELKDQLYKSRHPKANLEENQFFKIKYCHLDPDIRRMGRDNSEWQPAFGQSGDALSHLKNHKIGKGDIFIFFGLYKKAEIKDDKYSYVKDAKDIHVIYGYMQIGDVLDTPEKIRDYEKLRNHPHADAKHMGNKRNAIYIPSEKLLDTDKPGYGVFKYHKDLVLTKEGEIKSHWKLPKCFDKKTLTYHPDKIVNSDDPYFQSVDQGQEFIVIQEDSAFEDWIKSLLVHLEEDN